MIPFGASPEQWAQWSVLHRGWLFAAANALVLLGAWGAWQVGRATPRAHVATLIVIPALASVTFVWLAQMHVTATVLTRFDIALAEELQRTLSLDTLTTWLSITHLGDGWTRAVIGIAVAAVLWHRQHPRWCGVWVVAMAGIGLLNVSLKLLFERARPLYAHDLLVETSWSFPSGHASGGLVTYGMLAFVLCRLLPRVTHLAILSGAAVIALNVGLSRVLLQVHYGSDVLAGFAVGSAWLAACIALALFFDRRENQK